MLHIIPYPKHPGEICLLPSGTPAITQALAIVISPQPTAAASEVQLAIQKRLGVFPELAMQSRHRAKCYLSR